jgi:hypothetical protein
VQIIKYFRNIFCDSLCKMHDVKTGKLHSAIRPCASVVPLPGWDISPKRKWRLNKIPAGKSLRIKSKIGTDVEGAGMVANSKGKESGSYSQAFKKISFLVDHRARFVPL